MYRFTYNNNLDIIIIGDIMEKEIKKMITALTERTTEKAIEGFTIECNNEITNQVREYLDTLTEKELIEIQEYLNNLLNLCYDGKLLNIPIKEEELKMIQDLSEKDKFLLKETIIYFSGRLPIKTNLDILKKAYYLDDNKYIKLNITFTSLSTFDEEIENDFTSKLIPGSEYDDMLRSWTMAFFKNIDNPYMYKDQKTDDWTIAKKPRINRLNVNDENNKKKAGYYISDNLCLFYYKYIYRNLSKLSIMSDKDFYKIYIEKEFETNYVPKAFEDICKQYLVSMNLSMKIRPPFEKIGKYYYDLPKEKKNGEFDIVTLDSKGYVFYEVKFRNKKIDEKLILKEIEEVNNARLKCHKYGFFSKSGYEKLNIKNVDTYTLDDVYKIQKGKRQ